MQTGPLTEKRCALRDHLVNEIRAGRCPPGTALPSEGELGLAFGVSRTTVRSALDMLDRAGLIVRRKGRMTLVHPEAEHRLERKAGQPCTIAVVLTAERLSNLVFTGILESFYAHLPDTIHPRVFFHREVRPAIYAAAEAVLIDGEFGPENIAAVRAYTSRLIVLTRNVRGLPSVSIDNHAGGELMAVHAIERGHRRIGVLHYGERQSELEFAQRLKGIRSACARAGITPVEVAMNLRRLSTVTPQQAVDRLLRLESGISVILCLSDMLAMSVMERLAELNLTVPDRIAIIGFDDLPYSRYCTPALTTVRQPVEDLGIALAHGVIAMLDGRPACLGKPIRPQLVPRDSCPSLGAGVERA